MNLSDVRSLVQEFLLSAGFKKQGRGWMLEGPGLAWLYSLDSPRFSIDIGIDLYELSGSFRPTKVNYCHLLLDIDAIPGINDYDVRQAFSLDFELDDQTSTAQISRIMEALVSFSRERMDMESLRRSYRADELEPSIIVKEARALLQAS